MTIRDEQRLPCHRTSADIRAMTADDCRYISSLDLLSKSSTTRPG
jgi:hypothetical protein